MSGKLRIVSARELPELLRDAVDPDTLARATAIVDDVRQRGAQAVREYAVKFQEIATGTPLRIEKHELETAFNALPEPDRALLTRTADRIYAFASSQRAALTDMTMPIPGGQAGHTVDPVEIAGCYAPGGGFPLISSALMTAVTARAAGVKRIIVASPKPAAMMLAAAYISGAECLYRVGGAHAIAMLAYGIDGLPPCDIIVGPGSKWVTAAKKIVFGKVGIDMLAGQSELVVYADDSADPRVVAADLLAQAEHGFDSLPVLVTTSRLLIERTNAEIEGQLALLPTRETARASIGHGFAVLAQDIPEAIAAVDRIAPEHLELLCENANAMAGRFSHYGGLFIGAGAAEVLGDYGAGPNHTLPTGGTARYTGGLSVFNFLRIRTWMRIDKLDEARNLVQDARDLARHEALEGHARSAQLRLAKD